MNSKQDPSLTSSSGTASGSREPMNGPGGDRNTGERLRDVELDTQGEFLEDHQRDRGSKGVAGGHDDALETRRGDDDQRDRRGTARGD